MRAKTAEDLISDIEEMISRSVSEQEYRYLEKWVGGNLDPDVILLAIKDNLYRSERFNFSYVQKTLDIWRNYGIRTAREARNFILDRRVKAIRERTSKIARKTGDEDSAEEFLSPNEVVDLHGMRDYLTELFREGRIEAFLGTLAIQRHDDIMDYLPQDIVDYLEKNSNKPSLSGQPQ